MELMDAIQPDALSALGWLPIKDAPRTRRVLVCGWHWSESQGPLREAVVAQWNPTRDRWEAGSGILGSYGIRPTHYQPLPKVVPTSPVAEDIASLRGVSVYVSKNKKRDAIAIYGMLNREDIPFNVFHTDESFHFVVQEEHLDMLLEAALRWTRVVEQPKHLILGAIDEHAHTMRLRSSVCNQSREDE